MSTMFQAGHLLDTEGLVADDAEAIFRAADSFIEVSRRPVRKVPALRGKTLLTVFYENSTRTRVSFELAGKRLSMDTVNLSASGSSASKGESLYDTMKNLEAMRPDIVVLRHGASGAAHYVSKRANFAVINAGDGMHEHPTQALLDAYTIRKEKGRLAGLTVAICGDIYHSRVARSNAHLLTKLGATVRLAGPRTLLPPSVGSLGVEVFDRVEPAIEGADVVMALRIQQERIAGSFLPTLREYARQFCINENRLKAAKPDCIVMHPGPMNRGVEIDPNLADGKRSVILDQVESGLAVRMAVLYMLGTESSDRPSA